MATIDAIAGSRALDRQEHHELELEVLAEISAVIARQSGRRRTLSQVLEQLEQYLGMRHSLVRLNLPGEDPFTVSAARGPYSQGYADAGGRRPYYDRVIQSVFHSGRPATVRTNGESSMSMPLDRWSMQPSFDGGFICVPVFVHGRVVGTLSAFEADESPWSLEKYARVLGIVANMMGCVVTPGPETQINGHSSHVNGHGSSTEDDSRSLRSRVDALEKSMIIDALKETRGNVAAAARVLSITPRIIRYKIKKLGIDSRAVGGRPPIGKVQ